MTHPTKSTTKNHIVTLPIIAACLLVSLSTSLSANETAALYFSRTDVNSDGEISSEEYRHRMVEVFYAADNNKNGALERHEIADAAAEFTAVDNNTNDRIELREFLNRRMRDFRTSDLDSNGSLNQSEVFATYDN